MKNVQQMNRTEVIKELAGFAHPSWFHSLLDWETPQLNALLTYYRSGGQFPTEMVGKIYRTKGVGDREATAMISIDWAKTDGAATVFFRVFKTGQEIHRQIEIRHRRFGETTHAALQKFLKDHA